MNQVFKRRAVAIGGLAHGAADVEAASSPLCTPADSAWGSFAERAARREMTALLSRVPRAAMRHRDGRLEEVALDPILPGDRPLVRQGEKTG